MEIEAIPIQSATEPLPFDVHATEYVGKMVAPSPFLSSTNIQIAWDSTALGWLKQCPRLYYYNMIEGWRTKDEAIDLRFGIELHQAIHDYELSRAAGIPHWDAVHDVVRALMERTEGWNPDHRYKNRENLVRSVVWYFDKYEVDPAITHVMENGRPAVEVSFRIPLDWGPQSLRRQVSERDWDQAEQDEGHNDSIPAYVLCGHLDRVVSFADSLFVMDHKTTKTTPSEWYFNQFEPNNQMTLYTIAGQVVFQSPIKGVIIDVIQVLVDGSRFTRGFTYRTPDQIDEWMVDLRVHLQLAEQYANAGYWPMNDTACDKYGGCKFREICSKSPSVRGKFLEGNFVRGEKWNPLKSR